MLVRKFVQDGVPREVGHLLQEVLAGAKEGREVVEEGERLRHGPGHLAEVVGAAEPCHHRLEGHRERVVIAVGVDDAEATCAVADLSPPVLNRVHVTLSSGDRRMPTLQWAIRAQEAEILPCRTEMDAFRVQKAHMRQCSCHHAYGLMCKGWITQVFVTYQGRRTIVHWTWYHYQERFFSQPLTLFLGQRAFA